MVQRKARELNLNERSAGEGSRKIKSLSAFLGCIISSEGKDSGRRRGSCRTISPGSQSEDSEHIFSSLESGPTPPLVVEESTSVGAGILPSFPSLFRLFFFLSVAFSLSPSSSRFLLPVRRVPLRSKHADANSLVRGVSSEMKGGNQRL